MNLMTSQKSNGQEVLFVKSHIGWETIIPQLGTLQKGIIYYLLPHLLLHYCHSAILLSDLSIRGKMGFNPPFVLCYLLEVLLSCYKKTSYCCHPYLVPQGYQSFEPFWLGLLNRFSISAPLNSETSILTFALDQRLNIL